MRCSENIRLVVINVQRKFVSLGEEMSEVPAVRTGQQATTLALLPLSDSSAFLAGLRKLWPQGDLTEVA